VVKAETIFKGNFLLHSIILSEEIHILFKLIHVVD
jgi:hypothetical protein